MSISYKANSIFKPVGYWADVFEQEWDLVFIIYDLIGKRACMNIVCNQYILSSLIDLMVS